MYYVAKPDGLKERRETAVVVGINTITEQVYLWLDGCNKWVNATDVEPIRITPERLLSIGFVVSSESKILPIDCEKAKGYCSTPTEFRHTAINDYGSEEVFYWCNDVLYKDNIHYCDCFYIHNFQHAYRLCGLREFADNIKLEQ